MKKLHKISFEMQVSNSNSFNLDNLVQINTDFYVKPVRLVKGDSVRFAIPRPIVTELELKKTDTVYFVKYEKGFYLSFNNIPDTIKRNYKSRKLQAIGQYNTLYVVIPPMVQNLYREPIKAVKLIRTQSFKPYEWQIEFLTTDFT